MERWVDLDTEGLDEDLGTVAREVGNGNLGEDTKTNWGEEMEAVASEMSLQAPPGEHTAPESSSSNLFQIALGPHGSSPQDTVSSPFSCPSFSPALYPHSF